MYTLVFDKYGLDFTCQKLTFENMVDLIFAKVPEIEIVKVSETSNSYGDFLFIDFIDLKTGRGVMTYVLGYQWIKCDVQERETHSTD